jgi:hypothetical protein
METQTQFDISGNPPCFGEAGERLLRTTAVARRLGRTPRMIRYLAEANLLPGFKHGKLWFFREMDVAKYLLIREGGYVQ